MLKNSQNNGKKFLLKFVFILFCQNYKKSPEKEQNPVYYGDPLPQKFLFEEVAIFQYLNFAVKSAESDRQERIFQDPQPNPNLLLDGHFLSEFLASKELQIFVHKSNICVSLFLHESSLYEILVWKSGKIHFTPTENI